MATYIYMYARKDLRNGIVNIFKIKTACLVHSATADLGIKSIFSYAVQLDDPGTHTYTRAQFWNLLSTGKMDQM